MGSWSVYCSISKIAITAGQKCVLIPLKKAKYNNSYLPYLPFTLPIFGEYDDYGGIENIEEDENTKLLEEHFGYPIHDFCQFFTRGCIRTDEDDFPKNLLKNEELKELTFMFVDRQVYDFMSTIQKGENGAGHLEFGNPKLLTLLGFEYVGENASKKTGNTSEDPSRYKYQWSFNGDTNFFADGEWLNYKREGIYTFDSYNALEKHITLPEDKKWIKEKSMVQLWKYMDEEKRVHLLGYIIGVDRYTYSSKKHMKEMRELLEKHRNPDIDYSKLETLLEPYVKKDNSLSNAYIENLDAFGDRLAELIVIRGNLYCMSGCFEPFRSYLTPQCGEKKDHQRLLEEFAKINKSYLREEDDE